MSGVHTVELTGAQPTGRRVVAFFLPLFLVALFLVLVPGPADASAASASTAAAAAVVSGSAAAAASAQINIQAIICPIINALAAIFSGFPFLAGILDALRAAFGCPGPSPG